MSSPNHSYTGREVRFVNYPSMNALYFIWIKHSTSFLTHNFERTRKQESGTHLIVYHFNQHRDKMK